MESKISQELLENCSGHKEIWDCSLQDFAIKIQEALVYRATGDKLPSQVVLTATGFLKEKYTQGELQGTVSYEVSKAIDEALIYYTNVQGKLE